MDNKDDYPVLVYRCPGAHKAHDGHTFDSRQAKTPEEAEKLIKQGFHRSLPEAVEAAEAKAAGKAAAAPAGGTPPKGK